MLYVFGSAFLHWNFMPCIVLFSISCVSTFQFFFSHVSCNIHTYRELFLNQLKYFCLPRKSFNAFSCFWVIRVYVLVMTTMLILLLFNNSFQNLWQSFPTCFQTHESRLQMSNDVNVLYKVCLMLILSFSFVKAFTLERLLRNCWSVILIMLFHSCY